MSSLSEIRDPLHGYVRVNELEAGIVDTPTFQRLKRIKQLSIVHLVYPGAEHSRFTHSLGVMHLAGKTAKVLQMQDLLTEDEAQEVRLAALLHDVGHGPFSHTFEDLLWSVRGMTHEDVTIWLIEKGELAEVIEDGGYKPSKIAAMALGRYRDEKAFLGEIIAGPYCSDILDYLIRDAYFCGVEYGRIDTSRIIDSLSVCEGRLAVSMGSLYALEAFVIARY
ncbi:MAG: HD domain-containing protein, partial [Candidatus Geothermarchaeales archaeon]